MDATQKFLKDEFAVAEDSLLMVYREIGDFLLNTIKVKEIAAGIKGWFGKLNHDAAPYGYKGEEFAVAFEFDKNEYTEPQASAWVRQGNYKSDKFDLVDIKGVEALKVGKWNGDEYTLEDLKSMVAAFDAGAYNGAFKFDKIPEGGKLGHNETQKAIKEFLDGMPRFGSTQRLYIDGNTLKVDFTKVPRKLAMLLEAGAFPMKSVEVYFNFPFKGKRYSKVFKALAFFGDNVPACQGLDDVIKIYEPEEKAASTIDKIEYRVYNLNKEDEVITGGAKTYMKHTKEWHDCVQKVAARGDVTKPEAVCTWSLERTGNVFMKENGEAPDTKVLANKSKTISLDEMKQLDPTMANEMEVDGCTGLMIDLSTFEITKLKHGEVNNKMPMTPDEQKQLEAALKAKDDSEAKLKVANEEKEKLLKEKEAKEAELKAIREKDAEAGIMAKAEELLKTKIKPEAVDAFVTLYKALAAVEKVSVHTLKEGKITKGEDKPALEMFLKFVDAIPENAEIVKSFKESAHNKAGKDDLTDDADNAKLAEKVKATLKERNLPVTVENMTIVERELTKKEE